MNPYEVNNATYQPFVDLMEFHRESENIAEELSLEVDMNSRRRVTWVMAGIRSATFFAADGIVEDAIPS